MKKRGLRLLQYACDPGSFLDCLSCSPPARSLPAVRYTSIRRIGPLPRLRWFVCTDRTVRGCFLRSCWRSASIRRRRRHTGMSFLRRRALSRHGNKRNCQNALYYPARPGKAFPEKWGLVRYRWSCVHLALTASAEPPLFFVTSRRNIVYALSAAAS